MIPVRRSRLVDTAQLTGVVVEIDATREPLALSVLQAPLHERPDGQRVVFGYRFDVAGLGAWVDDRTVRFRTWPALIDESGEVVHDHCEGVDAELVIGFDADRDRQALTDLAEVGRLIVAGPDAGPVPLVIDVDPDLVRAAIDQMDG